MCFHSLLIITFYFLIIFYLFKTSISGMYEFLFLLFSSTFVFALKMHFFPLTCVNMGILKRAQLNVSFFLLTVAKISSRNFPAHLAHVKHFAHTQRVFLLGLKTLYFFISKKLMLINEPNNFYYYFHYSILFLKPFFIDNLAFFSLSLSVF